MMSGMLPKVNIIPLLSAISIGSMKKKLQQAAKYKDCPVIGEWTKSITNHMYWCASSSPDGDDDKMMNL